MANSGLKRARTTTIHKDGLIVFKRKIKKFRLSPVLQGPLGHQKSPTTTIQQDGLVVFNIKTFLKIFMHGAANFPMKSAKTAKTEEDGLVGF